MLVCALPIALLVGMAVSSWEDPILQIGEEDGEEKAVAFLERRGGKVARDDKFPGKPVVSVSLNLPQVTAAELKALASFKSLAKLDLRGADVAAIDLKEIAPLMGLKLLMLNNNQVTDQTLLSLREINLLHTLSHVNGSGNNRPAGPDEVTSIQLCETGVTEAGLKELAGFKNLKMLFLGSMKITPAGRANAPQFTILAF